MPPTRFRPPGGAVAAVPRISGAGRPRYPGPVALPLLPDDPDEWSDEQWLAWLEEGDAAERVEAASAERPALPTWRKGPIAMQFLAASMTAVGEAIYGRRDKPAIVIEAAGDPPGDDGLDVQLDFDHPEESVVVVREWLLRHHDGEFEEIVDHEPDREPHRETDSELPPLCGGEQ
jgi:hypothetical protein